MWWAGPPGGRPAPKTPAGWPNPGAGIICLPAKGADIVRGGPRLSIREAKKKGRIKTNKKLRKGPTARNERIFEEEMNHALTLIPSSQWKWVPAPWIPIHNVLFQVRQLLNLSSLSSTVLKDLPRTEFA
jgi:hypothetical protein